VCESVWEYGCFPVVETSAPCATTQGKVDVVVNGKAVKALKDSGVQIPLISQNLSQEISADPMGRIMIDGVVASALVPLTNVDIQLAAEPGTVNLCTPELPVVCGIVDMSDKVYDMILPADVAKELQIPVVSVVVAKCVNADDSTNAVVDVSSDQVQSVSADTFSLMSGDVTNAEFCNNSTQSDELMNDDASKLLEEQQQDASRTDCWSMARQCKGNFVVSRGLLYRKDKVEGQPVCQLCVPTTRREPILKLAHDSVYGGHLGERKTCQRIKLSFYCPGLKKSVREYVMSCQNCQLRARKLTTDRVPITPLTRDQIPFQTLKMDCIGPLEPPSAQGHKYCLCIVDSCKRWTSVYLLKSLTARVVIALLDLFVNVGVPKVIVNDCETNFTSQLTQEMLRKLGCAPRFNTPGHPEASGIVERFNQTCKKMLHHVIQQHGRQWHKFVPLMLWALREIPNAATGTSPYMFVYGRNPRGPLTILKMSWTGENDTSASLAQPVADYLLDLRSKLFEAAQFAQSHTDAAQQGYAAHYNLTEPAKEIPRARSGHCVGPREHR